MRRAGGACAGGPSGLRWSPHALRAAASGRTGVCWAAPRLQRAKFAAKPQRADFGRHASFAGPVFAWSSAVAQASRGSGWLGC